MGTEDKVSAVGSFLRDAYKGTRNVLMFVLVGILVAGALLVVDSALASRIDLVAFWVAVFALFVPIPRTWFFADRWRALGVAVIALGVWGAGKGPADPEAMPARRDPTVQADVQSQPSEKAQSARVESQKSPTAPKLSDRTRQAIWIDDTKKGVRAWLRDGRSARFNDVFFHAYQGKTPVVCGQVNAKNALGGYTGFKRFVASDETLVFFETDMDYGEFMKVWNELCLE